jgi:hypothetical protein
MVSQATQDFAFSLLDASQEYSTKLLILFLIAIYLLGLNYWTNSFTESENWQLLTKFFVRIVSGLYIYSLPLLVTLMLYRAYELVELRTLFYYSYTVITIVALFTVSIFGWEKFLAIIGYPNLAPRLKKRTRT